jgi:YegS/Rv2252/BmrU family lipid kinase
MNFIVNPAAGRGDYMKLIGRIESRFPDARIIITKEPKEATDIALRLSNEGAEPIVAAGGDGTVVEVASGILKSDNKNAVLGILPVGTGNDLARTLGIKENLDFAFDVITQGAPKDIDVIRVNDDYCLNIASIGMDTEIAAYQVKIKKRFKNLSYLFSIIRNIFIFRPFEARIEIGGQSPGGQSPGDETRNVETLSGKFTLVAVANGVYYGRGVKIAPDAKIDDGLMSVCVVRAIPNFKMALIFPKAIKGTHGSVAEVSFYDAKNVTIEAEAAAGIDGNILPLAKKFQFEIIERGLKVLAPFDNRADLY